MLTTDRSRRLMKEGGWIVFGQLLLVVGSLAGVRILTELLPREAYGELALGMTIATLVNQIILGPLSGGIMRFYAPAIEQGDLGGYLNAVKRLVSYATVLISLLIVIACVGLITLGKSQWVVITASAMAFALIGGYGAISSGIQSAARQRAVVALHQGVEPLLRVLVAAGLIVWLGTSSTMAMIGYAVASMLVLGSQMYFLQKILRGKSFIENENDWKQNIWRFSWPIGVFGIFTWFQLVSDRWALQFFSSTSDVGSYAVLYQLGYYPISLLTGMAMQFLVPILYQRAGDAKDSKRNADANLLGWRLTWISLVLTGVAFLVVMLLHVPIFYILVAEEYRSVSYLMPWIILSGGVFASGQTLALNLQAQMKTREMMTAKIATALLGVALNFAGAFWYGITGIIGAGLLFAALYFVWMAVLVNNGSKKVCFC
jgi:O-antigen/teichoic acid export membrane protein